ncbi:strumpellin and WASH-interacting protein isoform X2 [Choristoneura fumiferana]|uniref:strumpellin and WASH-interacting protein isoform X2 n=1 Tax=Choristoneura fumiferana TaxID=7141 RepID=UPI003D15BE22
MRTDLEKEAGSVLLKKYGQFFKQQYQDCISLANNEIWEENKTYLPVQVAMEPCELIPITELVSSDNTLMTKVLSVLSSLCFEVMALKKEAYERHFVFLAVHDEYSGTDISSQMEAICQLSAFTGRCEETLKNLCTQMFAIFSESINLSRIQLHYIINHIGEMFTVLVLLELLISNSALTRNWLKYCKHLKSLKQSTETVDLTDDKFSAVLGAIDNITSKVMSDDIVQNSLNSLLGLRKSLIDKNCAVIAEQFSHYLRHAISSLDKLVQDKPNVSNMNKCIKINVLFVLNSHLFGNSDKKIFKSLMELNAKAHSIHVMGTTVWFPEQFLQRNYNQIMNSVNMVIQHLTFQASCSVLEVKKSLMGDKNFANKRLDDLTCIVIAERALKGTVTQERNIAANIALSFIPESIYLEDSYEKLGLLLEKIQTLANFLKSMEDLCNCSWVLWHQNIIPIYFEQNFTTQLNVLKLKYFLLVLEDCVVLLHKTDKQYSEDKANALLDDIKTLITDNVLKTTNQNIETNLRLHIHSHLQLDVVNPFTTDMTKKLLLVIDTFRVQCVYMSVIPSTEHYLSTMYYNLTTVVLSDWKTYGEMRQMAKFKFNLITVEDNLPTQTHEQGLDVLEIMRNIHIFVSKYLYNLNNQIFIEKSSNNKHLNSINIKHIANSIRTHGTGIMNTTVNFTYQFLKKKFFTFSQFMYDEHIKSRLIKDFRNFKEVADTNGNMYPYKSAEKFNKSIKVLGLAEDGQSYLDLFRDLISQIGNAMGYVRMIRSGGRHCCSDATAFLPSLEPTKSFKNLAEESNIDSKAIQASEVLDNNINCLITNFIQGTEYFKLLLDVFTPVFRNPKNVHLKNFYIIVPPLTLNFVEHMILSKDKMSKRNKVGAAFTDDGFAMGIAYILKLLDQDSNFEALHWFDSVWKHIKEERKNLEEQKAKGSLQLQQALALTEKKIKTLEEEFKLLYYSLTSARIFFR